MPRQAERWLAVKRACDAEPGRWVLVSKNALLSWSTHVSTGRLSAFRPPGTYEAITRKGNGYRGWLFIRRVPEDA